VTGVRHIQTALHGRVRIDAERSAAAIEAMARFAVPPQWLCYLPPTMSPVATSPREGWLERPEEAFAFYRDRGVIDLVVEEKHMGSRALIALGRDEDAAGRRFGQPEGGARRGRIWTRRGRAFLEDVGEAVILARLAAAAEAAGLWSELGSDWALLDAEILPWSAKAGPLIEAQYAPVGEAARMGLALAQAALAATVARLHDAAPLAASLTEREARVARYDAAWRGYVWDAPRPEDLRVAPFHVLASEGAVHMDRPHDWHMGWNARLAGTGEPVLEATEWHRLDAADEAACQEIVAWWEARTAAGGEGMVVKPRAFTVRDRKGRLVQPALKVRGRDYLRIIYGPDYDAPENLVRLKERTLDRKRNLALSEYALGHEALTRFVAGEPLRRWHDCVLATLALESEPVDPRL
jgi:protein phosphatase